MRFMKTIFRARHRRAAMLTAALAGAGLAGACRETIDGGANCSVAAALCPGQALDIRDTIIDPVLVFDSTYGGFPARGTETFIPLISMGNDLETVAVLRFDTLTTIHIPRNDTLQAIRYVDSVFVRLVVDRTRSQIPDSVRIDLYDVNDTTAADSASAPILARFVPKYLIGGRTFSKASLVDSILVPVRDSAMLASLADSSSGWPRLRVGVRVSGPGPVAFRIGTIDGGAPARLRYRPQADTSARLLGINLASSGPKDRDDLKRDLLDYSLVMKNNLPAAPGTMLLGGVPGRRAYLRFNIPRRLSDSSTIIRATLRLNQVAYAFGSSLDTVVIHPHIVLASPQVLDNRRAASLIGAAGLVLSDSISVLPREAGRRELEMFPLVRAWAAQGTGANLPLRALVLAVSNEGTLPRIAAFSSNTAAPGLRPSMRITYTANVGFGVP